MTETTGEEAVTKWVVELEGGPAFPVNAATACRVAARDLPYLAAVFRRLEAALSKGRPADTTGKGRE